MVERGGPGEGLIHSGPPIIDLSRIGKIATYEVQEMELERLDSLVASENQAVAFTTFMGGILIATFLGWLAAEKLSAVATAIYVAVMGFSFVLTLWFGATWLRAKRERPKLLASVRERSRVVAESPTAKS